MIKKYNLDPSLQAWIMEQTGLGPGLGKVRYLCKVGSSSNFHYSWLRDELKVPPDLIHHELDAAYNALTANRNDLILVMPGTYTTTARLAWTKDHSHMLGLGGANNEGDHSLAGVTIYTSTTQVVETIDLTGDRCVFGNFLIGNGGNHAENLTAMNIDGWGNHFKNVKFIGQIADNQVNVEACCSLSIDRLGHFPLFENCTIGQNNWNERTAVNSGVLRFIGTTAPAPQNGLFKNCNFQSRSETVTCAMVALPVNTCIERGWRFVGCDFSNFSQNAVNTLNQVFYDNCGSSHNILLRDCSAQGIDEWQDADQGAVYIGATMPAVDTGGGLVRNPTTITYAGSDR